MLCDALDLPGGWRPLGLCSRGRLRHRNLVLVQLNKLIGRYDSAGCMCHWNIDAIGPAFARPRFGEYGDVHRSRPGGPVLTELLEFLERMLAVDRYLDDHFVVDV